jgi:hypothetical protein
MKTRIFILIALLCSFVVGRTNAQTGSFSAYSSQSIRVVTTGAIPSLTTQYYFTQNVTVSGSTSMPGNTTARHWLTVKNKLTHAGVLYGGMYTSQQVCANCQLNYTATGPAIITTASDGFDIEVPNTAEPDYNMICSVAGTFGHGSISNKLPYFTLAYVRAYSLVTRTNCGTWGGYYIACDIAATNWCNAASTPADITITQVRDLVGPPPVTAPDYWDLIGLCYRYNIYSKWTCPQSGAFGSGSHGVPETVQCTARNKSIP